MSRDVRLEEGIPERRSSALTHTGYCARCGRSSLGVFCRTCSKNPKKPLDPPELRVRGSGLIADRARLIKPDEKDEEDTVATQRTCENPECRRKFTQEGGRPARFCSVQCKNRSYHLDKLGIYAKPRKAPPSPPEVPSEKEAVVATAPAPAPTTATSSRPDPLPVAEDVSDRFEVEVDLLLALAELAPASRAFVLRAAQKRWPQ